MTTGGDRYSVLQTGEIKTDVGSFFGGIPWATYHGWPDVLVDPSRRITLGVNSLLLRQRGQLTLIDTGFSAWAREPEGLIRIRAESHTQYNTVSRMVRGLKSAGVGVEDINTVIITSPDTNYVHGVLTLNRGKGLKPQFPRARVYIVDSLTGETDELLRDSGLRWERITEDGEVAPGVEAKLVGPIAALKIHCGGERIMYLSEICPTHYHLQELECNPVYDPTRGRTIEAKTELVSEAIRGGYLCVFPNGLKVVAGYPSGGGGHDRLVRILDIGVHK
jgi:hypothetical protein